MSKKRSGGPDMDALREYAILEDRQLTPFFAGRESIINRIEDACRRVLEDCRNGKGTNGRTWLIQGAPGAGKTSLLDYLAKRWRRFGEGSPVAIWADRKALVDSSAFSEAIAAAAGAGESFRTARSKSKQAAASFLGSFSAKGSRSAQVTPLPATLASLAKVKPAEGWRQPVCVMIDEIQLVERRHQDGLQDLHLAEHGLPILPILAGLGNSEEVLGGKDIQLSRISPSCVCDLGRLEPSEARQSVLKFLEVCFVEASEEEAETWSDEIADLSDCWPQLLRGGIAALSAELCEARGKLADIDREVVVDRTARMREEAYNARLSPEMETSSTLVAKLMRLAGTRGVSRNEAVDAIRGLAAGAGGPSSESLPHGDSADAFLEELVRKGALQRIGRGDKRLASPIPSFRDFLVREGYRIHVSDFASAEDAVVAAAACNREHEAGGGRASDLRFLAESDRFGHRVELVGGCASEADVERWAEIAADAARRSRKGKISV